MARDPLPSDKNETPPYPFRAGNKIIPDKAHSADIAAFNAKRAQFFEVLPESKDKINWDKLSIKLKGILKYDTKNVEIVFANIRKCIELKKDIRKELNIPFSVEAFDSLTTDLARRNILDFLINNINDDQTKTKAIEPQKGSPDNQDWKNFEDKFDNKNARERITTRTPQEKKAAEAIGANKLKPTPIV